MAAKQKKKNRVRAKAVGVFRDGDRIFVSEGYDIVRRQFFYTQLGGRIEFGESAAETVKRELLEEIGTVVKDLRFLGTLENIFTYAGQPNHEIILAYAGRFADHTIYRTQVVLGTEKDTPPGHFKCVWLPLEIFRRGELPLYPNGILRLLEQTQP